MQKLMLVIPMAVLVVVVMHAQSRTTTPVASIKQLQEAMVSPSSDVIFNVGRAAPENDAEWLVVRNAAVILAEAGNLFMLEDRARDADLWMELAGELVESGRDALVAAEARNVDGLLQAGDRIAAACEACHQPYRDGGRAMGPQSTPNPDDPPLP